MISGWGKSFDAREFVSREGLAWETGYVTSGFFTDESPYSDQT